MKKNTKRAIRGWLFLIAIQIPWISACVYDATTREPMEYEVEIETEENIIRWKEGEYAAE